MTLKYNNAKKDASRTLIYYIKTLVEKTNAWRWDNDNDAEIRGIVGDIEMIIDEKIALAISKLKNVSQTEEQSK